MIVPVSWTPISVRKCLNALINANTINNDWTTLIPGVSCDPCPIDPTSANQTDIDDHYGPRFDECASKLVNNRVANPVKDVAYGKQSTDENDNVYVYDVHGADERDFNRKLIGEMLTATGYGAFLMERFVWTAMMCASSVAVFFLSTLLFYDYEVWSGLLGTLCAGGVVLLWIAFRYFEERSIREPGSAFRARGSMAPIQAAAMAMHYFDDKLDDFIEEIDDYQSECIKNADSKSGNYRDNADWIARTIASWAVARRAAQYISFQPINVEEIYTGNGVSARRMLYADIFYILTLLGVLALVGLVVITAPQIIHSISPEAAQVFGNIDVMGFSIAPWPLLLVAFLILIVLSFAEADRGYYKKDRNRIALALIDFWRQGKLRTAEEIVLLNVPPSKKFDDWYPKASARMLGTTAGSEAHEAWKSECEWNDKLIKTDPTPRLMQRLIDFFTHLKAPALKLTFSDGEQKEAPERRFDHARQCSSDARPRTRAMATITRREIWHP